MKVRGGRMWRSSCDGEDVGQTGSREMGLTDSGAEKRGKTSGAWTLYSTIHKPACVLVYFYCKPCIKPSLSWAEAEDNHPSSNYSVVLRSLPRRRNPHSPNNHTDDCVPQVTPTSHVTHMVARTVLPVDQGVVTSTVLVDWLSVRYLGTLKEDQHQLELTKPLGWRGETETYIENLHRHVVTHFLTRSYKTL